MKDEVLAYIEGHSQEALELLMEIARIPAPSNHEEKRAEFCKGWLEQQGAKGVYVDEALNVVYPVGVTADKPLVVFMAHLDVVFPDTEELPLRVENGCIYAPGVGDDTANLAALLMAAKYIAKNQLISPEYGILLVCNSGEEGLGNLKGSRKICETYGKNMTAFYTFDGTCSHIVAKAVGSRRYQVEVKTEGGHSYGDFGNRNAIAMLASMIHEIYKIQVPLRGKTTYNVGMISGGTSVNTIAQQAQMLFEYRSDDLEDLQEMEETFRAIVTKYEERGINLEVRLLGERPCGLAKDQAAHRALIRKGQEAVERYCHHTPDVTPGSTDCNIPLSMGIPSICVGCYQGAGAHTREEYVVIDSLKAGYHIAMDLILSYFSD